MSANSFHLDRKDKKINIRGREKKHVGNSVQAVRNSTKTKRELLLEMRISTKRGKCVELLGEGERETDRQTERETERVRDN